MFIISLKTIRYYNGNLIIIIIYSYNTVETELQQVVCSKIDRGNLYVDVCYRFIVGGYLPSS